MEEPSENEITDNGCEQRLTTHDASVPGRRRAGTWLRRLVVCGILAGLGWVLFGNRSDTTRPPELTVSDWLVACSPFQSIDGSRLLTFAEKNHAVVLEEAIGEERAGGALSAAHPQTTNGNWTADEANKYVVVVFEGNSIVYRLVISFSQDQCILARGSFESTDLANSWFGTPTFEEPDEDEPSKEP